MTYGPRKYQERLHGTHTQIEEGTLQIKPLISNVQHLQQKKKRNS